MKTINGYSSTKSPMLPQQNQGYLGYLTSKQLLQLNKLKKERDESDRESFVSGHSKNRRSKLRQDLIRREFSKSFS